MHRFFLPPTACQGPELALSEDESHHAMDVLRVRRGDEVIVMNGAGGEHRCVITELQRGRLRVAVVSSQQHPTPSPLILVQSILKGKAMETVLQKAAELGATRVIPLLAERTVPHLDDRTHGKSGRWRSTLQQALKQCGNPWMPILDPPLALPDCLNALKTIDLSLLADLSPNSRHPRAWFDAWRQEHPSLLPSVAVWIGPEGDFTPSERAQILAHRGCSITLGPWVLRSETAALYCLSVICYELQSR